MKPIHKLFIANRGEIAIRIAKTAKKMGISTVGIYTSEEIDAQHLNYVDEAFELEGNSIAETYLNINQIIQLALKSKADAIHPAYGFLSENAQFAKACELAELVFVGPKAGLIELMGKKDEAIEFVKSLKVPVLSVFKGSLKELKSADLTSTYPLIVKASTGGGGKGMNIATSREELIKTAEMTARMAKNYFGSEQLIVERYLKNARHIEVQVLGDQHGNIVHLFERECSIQRRFQKIIEEAPSPTLTPLQRKTITDYALKIAKAANYTNAGTIEFLLSEENEFHFLEMNTRIQVEHPVTEMITNTDLVELQLRIAMGEVLPEEMHHISIHGHAIEARIYSEDPEKDFLPEGGTVFLYKTPKKTKLRIDAAIGNNQKITSEFDPMMAKIISHGKDRNESILKLVDGLNELKIIGPRNNLDYLKEILENKDFQQNKVSTTFIHDHHNNLLQKLKQKKTATHEIAALIGFIYHHFESIKPKSVWEKVWHQQERTIDLKINNRMLRCILNNGELKIDGIKYKPDFHLINSQESTVCLNDIHFHVFVKSDEKNHQDKVFVNGHLFFINSPHVLKHIQTKKQKEKNESLMGKLTLKSGLYGKVVRINVEANQQIHSGDVLLIIESMKTENEILAPVNGKIKELNITEGLKIEDNTPLLTIEIN